METDMKASLTSALNMDRAYKNSQTGIPIKVTMKTENPMVTASTIGSTEAFIKASSDKV